MVKQPSLNKLRWTDQIFVHFAGFDNFSKFDNKVTYFNLMNAVNTTIPGCHNCMGNPFFPMLYGNITK